MSAGTAVEAAACPLADPDIRIGDECPEFDLLVAELGDPFPGRRPWTPDERDEETGTTTLVMKRACNGCHFPIGDVTDEEIGRAVDGLPLLDVRGECLVCAAIPAPRAAQS